MLSQSKLNRLVIELTRATVERDLLWRRTTPPEELVIGTSNIIPSFYEATRGGRVIAIFIRRYQKFDLEHERLFWQETIVLGFLDSMRRVSWEHSEYSPALHNLFEAVKEESADIDGVIDEFLAGNKADSSI